MIPQKKIFFDSEGNGFYERNESKVIGRTEDPFVIPRLDKLGIKPKSVLELGCSNGWRLHLMQTKWGSSCSGVEPSELALKKGKFQFPELNLIRGVADSLPFPDGSFDLVIAGFCLYVCDRRDLFTIAKEMDRVLSDNGHIAIVDFFAPTPYRNSYAHHSGVSTYKMDYSSLFTWNPEYQTVTHDIVDENGATFSGQPDDALMIGILQKSIASAYPEPKRSK